MLWQSIMRQIICDKINLVHILPALLLPSEKMHRSNQKQPIRIRGRVLALPIILH